MRVSFKAVMAVMLGMLLYACASGGAGGPGSRSADEITPEEVDALRGEVTNALQIVERLRPRWLREAGNWSVNLETAIVAYQDRNRLGSVEELRLIPIGTVRSIRALSASEAMILPGLGSQHVERAIVVETIR